jgi:hypothetical protein
MDAHINNKSTLHALHGNPIKVMKEKKKKKQLKYQLLLK